MILKSTHPPFIFEDDKDPGYVYRGMKDKELKFLDVISGMDNVVDFEVLDDTIDINGKSSRLVRIKKVPADIRIQELTLKQAKKLLCDQIDLCVECIKSGICLADIHESNILYWAGKSYFIDLNAFSNIDGHKGLPFSYVKMAYMVNKYLGLKNEIKSSIYADHITIKSYNDWSAHNYSNAQDLELWLDFRNYVHSYKIANAKSTHWSDEYANDDDKLKENKKTKIVNSIISHIKEYSILDVGTNKGYYLNMFNNNYERLIGFDCDGKCIDIAESKYGNSKTTFVKFNIEFLFGNTNKIIDRYKSDMVLALAVTHHFSTNMVNATEAASTLALLSSKYILIEDIDNIDIYESVFSEAGFNKIKTVDSDPPRRKLSLWLKS